MVCTTRCRVLISIENLLFQRDTNAEPVFPSFLCSHNGRRCRGTWPSLPRLAAANALQEFAVGQFWYDVLLQFLCPAILGPIGLLAEAKVPRRN